MGETEQKKGKLLRLNGLEEHMLFPVYLLIEPGPIDSSMLEGDVAYIWAGDGLYVYKHGAVFSSLTKTDKGLAGLADGETRVTYRFEPMPKALALKVLGFFAWASATHHTEAIVLPYYNADTAEWKIVVPEQRVSLGDCDYDTPLTNPPGFVRIGSWHSHGSMSAYHSQVDHHDESKDEGVHVTSGSFAKNSNTTRVSCSLMVDGTRYSLTPEAVFDGLAVKEKTKGGTVTGTGKYKTITPVTKQFSLVHDKGDTLDFPDEWKEKVTVLKVEKAANASTGVGGGTTVWDYDYYNAPGTGPKCSSCALQCGIFISPHVLRHMPNIIAVFHGDTEVEGVDAYQAILDMAMNFSLFVDKDVEYNLTLSAEEFYAASVEAKAKLIKTLESIPGVKAWTNPTNSECVQFLRAVRASVLFPGVAENYLNNTSIRTGVSHCYGLANGLSFFSFSTRTDGCEYFLPAPTLPPSTLPQNRESDHKRFLQQVCDLIVENAAAINERKGSQGEEKDGPTVCGMCAKFDLFVQFGLDECPRVKTGCQPSLDELVEDCPDFEDAGSEPASIS